MNHCIDTPLLRQVYATIPTICLNFTNGFVLGLQSVVVPSLRNSSLKLTVDQESWLASISFLMLFPGDCICGPLSDVFGRKRIVIFSLMPQIVTCILLYFAEDYSEFFLAFLIAGFWGAGFTVAPMYIAETTSPKYRGSLLNSKVAALHMGLALTHYLGNFLHWRTLTLCGVLPNVIGVLIAIIVPESPAWLASKGRFDECKAAFTWFRNNRDGKELDKLLKQQNNALNRKSNVIRTYSNFQKILNYLRHPGFPKAIVICTTCYIFIGMNGKQIFIVYVFDMISSLVSDKTNVYYYALGLDLADVLSLSVSCFLVKKFRRRFLVFSVGAPALFLLLVVTAVSFLLTKGYIHVQYSYILLVLLTIYFSMLNLAVTPNLFAVAGEIYPLSHRAIGATFSGFIFVLIAFIVTKISPFLMIKYDVYGTFMLSFVIASLALLYLYFYMPETNNKTLQDIEEEMNGELQGVMLNQMELTQKILE